MSNATKEPHANHLAAYEMAGLSSEGADDLLRRTVKAVTEAGQALLKTYSRITRQKDLQQLLASIKQQEGISAPILKGHLEAALPNTHWDEDEFDGGDLPKGLWWITDAVEGNINLIQGMPEWCTTADLWPGGCWCPKRAVSPATSGANPGGWTAKTFSHPRVVCTRLLSMYSQP